MTDDITHNLTVVREALEAEGLGVHVKLIDAAIEDVAKLHAQIASARKALQQVVTVCGDNAGHNAKHDMALRFVRNVAKTALN